jgi:hypothetical protein
MPDLSFDPHQFLRRTKAVTAETGIAFSDYEKMHIERHSTKVWRRRPEKIAWAFNDTLLKNTILTFLERRYFVPQLPDLTDEERIARIEAHAKWRETSRQIHLNDRLDAYKKAKDEDAPAKRLKELEIEAQNADSRLRFDRRPVELVTSIVYLSYRLGFDSTQVAEQLGILPPHVRIVLMRLNFVAADLATGRPYKPVHCKGRGKHRPWSKRELVRLWFLRNSGLSWAKCAKALGRETHHRNVTHGSNLIAVYQRYFEQYGTQEREARQWTRSKLQGLWVLRAVGKTWVEVGKVFGVSAVSAQAAYSYHFNGKKAS